jgi:hypothetical protein
MAEISVTDFELEDEKLGELATQAAYRLDSQLHVQFYKHAELDAAASKAAGRKIFAEHVYVRIMAPANRLNVIECRATDEYKLRFARQYAQFLQGVEQLSVGTPLSELPSLSAAQVLELKALKVDTVEQLANLPDTTVQLLGVGGMELKRRAAAFIMRAQSNDALAAQNQDLQRQITELQLLLQERQKEEQAASQATPQFKVTSADKKA